MQHQQGAYTVKDETAVTHSFPFPAANDALAMRFFEQLIRDKQTTPGQHPTEHNMYCVGTYDAINPGDSSYCEPRLICRGSDFFAGELAEVKENSDGF